MFSDLDNLLNFNPDSLSDGQCISVIEYGSADASFVLHHFITTYLKTGRNVCLVGLAQSFNHYNCVASKLGVSMTKLRESGQFVMVEALRCIGTDIVTTNDDFPTGPAALHKLFITIKSAVLSLETWNVKSTLLIIDDLSILVSLGFSAWNVSTFLQYLQTIVCPSAKSIGSLVSLIHCDKCVHDEDMDLLCTRIGYQSDIVLNVNSLRTGYCKDVHGEVSVEFRNVGQLRGPEMKSMHYKVGDRNVLLFPMGTSTAVL